MRQKSKLLVTSLALFIAVMLVIAIAVEIQARQVKDAPVYFDGQDYFVMNETLPTNFTVSLWVFYTNFSNGTGVIMSAGIGNNMHSGWYIGSGGELKNSTACGIFSDVKTSGNITAGWRFAKTSFIGIGKWYNLVCTYNTSYISLYINGKLANTTATPFTGISTNIIEIGKRTSEFYTNNTPSYNPFFGYLTNINVYNSILNSSQILYLYNGGMDAKPNVPYIHIPLDNENDSYLINGTIHEMQAETIQ